MPHTVRIWAGLRRSCTLRFARTIPVSPSEDVSFVVSLHVVVGSGWCIGGMDAAPHLQAHHRGFRAADVLDGDRQGPEDRMGDAAAGPLPCAPCSCNGPDPDYRAEVL